MDKFSVKDDHVVEIVVIAEHDSLPHRRLATVITGHIAIGNLVLYSLVVQGHRVPGSFQHYKSEKPDNDSDLTHIARRQSLFCNIKSMELVKTLEKRLYSHGRDEATDVLEAAWAEWILNVMQRFRSRLYLPYSGTNVYVFVRPGSEVVDLTDCTNIITVLPCLQAYYRKRQDHTLQRCCLHLRAWHQHLIWNHIFSLILIIDNIDTAVEKSVKRARKVFLQNVWILMRRTRKRDLKRKLELQRTGSGKQLPK